MVTPLRPMYILYKDMEPLGNLLVGLLKSAR